MKPIVRKTLAVDAKEALYNYISEMDLSASTKLPPEVELAAGLGVSRVTLRRALDELEYNGLLLRIHGKGTFVNPSAFHIQVDLSRMQEFGEIIQKSGHIADMEVLSVRRVQADPFDTGWPESVVQVEKLYCADGMPAILSVAQIPETVFRTMPDEADWARHSNFEILYSHGERIILRDKLEITTYSVPELREKIPAIGRFSCASVLSLSGWGFDQNNRPAILGTAYYNTDLIVFNIFRHS
ncbi:MAG: GntR family transcriptional regulator [Oscillospiraceae bacterium]|nr:GntR family transcriptional regulator [Oscillospiraceae bacterium]